MATPQTYPAIRLTGFHSVYFDTKSKQTNSKPKMCNQLMTLASDDKKRCDKNFERPGV